MGPAKGAEVSTNDSTLGDPAAQEPPMKQLAWDIQKQKKLLASFRGALPPDHPTSPGPAGGFAPKRSPAPNLPLHH